MIGMAHVHDRDLPKGLKKTIIMRTRLIHAADIHLGYLQYGLDERAIDFTRALEHLITETIQTDCQCLLIAGDFFHNRSIDSQTLYSATKLLERLREAGIPVVVIEGNHDKAYRSEGYSWLSYLNQMEYIRLLSFNFSDEGIQLSPFDDKTRSGSYTDIAGTGIRIYGLPWVGAQTRNIMSAVSDYLRKVRADEERQGVRFRILMMHTGVDGEDPRLKGLPAGNDFRVLKDLVNYIALGHVHKPYTYDGYIYNPGSLETVNIEEAKEKRGYYQIDVQTDTAAAAPEYSAELIITPKRPFLQLSYIVDGVQSQEELLEDFTRFLRRHKQEFAQTEEKPVAHIYLRGNLAFDRTAFNMKQLYESVAIYKPLHIIIHDNTDSAEAIDLPEDDTRSSIQSMEKDIFYQMALSDARFANAAEQWSQIMQNLKQHSLNGDPAEAICDWFIEEYQRVGQSDQG